MTQSSMEGLTRMWQRRLKSRNGLQHGHPSLPGLTVVKPKQNNNKTADQIGGGAAGAEAPTVTERSPQVLAISHLLHAALGQWVNIV
jgi:hypothetical protein